MREIQSEVIGDRRVRLVAGQAGRYAVTIEVWGRRAGKISACAPIVTSACTQLACATACGAASSTCGQSYGTRSKARHRSRCAARRSAVCL